MAKMLITNDQYWSLTLDEQQTENVSGASSERKPLEDTRQRESEAERLGDRTDAADRLGRSEGDSERGNLRELTEEETQVKAEELSETVEREIEQKSTEKPKGNNFVIGDSLNLPNGEKAKYRANVDAIRLIKQLETEGRYATTAEQEILSKYVGWGGLDKAFGEYRYNRDTRRSEMAAKDGWEKEFAELKSLVDEGIITEQEYKDMSASTKNAHYTSVEVIKAMYDGLASLGFKGGRMLEPSSGVGNFVGAMPLEMTAKVNSWTMVELDRITGLIAKYLYPNSDVRIQGFENANIPDNYMDVAIGNVPFGNFGVVDRTYPKRLGGTLVLNPDGHEWKRSKWSPAVRRYWKYSEKAMVRQADCVVCDSENIEKYILQEYGAMQPKTCYIAYGADLDSPEDEDSQKKYDKWLREHDLKADGYYLVVGRFVPENNFETMLREFMASHTECALALVTNSNEKLRAELEQALGFGRDARIRFVGTVYDAGLLRCIREHARAYLHGHEVGGTNPSLLEALSATPVNLLLDVGFNREVGRDAALYWSKAPGSLSALIDHADALDEAQRQAMGQRARDRIRQAYSWPFIADEYRKLWLAQERTV